jgi:hypothetical protein
VLHLGEAPGIDRLGRVLLLHDAQHAVVEMLVKVLSIAEGLGASAALARRVSRVCISPPVDESPLEI